MKDDEDAIRRLVETWHAATAAGDVDAILALMADDAVFLVAGHAPMRGRNDFELGLRALLKTHRIESHGDIHEIGVDGGLAYCWSDLTVRIVPLAGGSASVRHGSALSILRKGTDGRWRLVRDANLLVPES